ncbi:MAG: alpha/beta fold hydrolase [Steroidobacteraceae bacterium]|jgi:polyhydroxyalkanoate synthase
MILDDEYALNAEESITVGTPPDQATGTVPVAPAVSDARGDVLRAHPDVDAYAPSALGDVVDRSLHAAAAQLTLGLSPAALVAAYADWATHLAMAPGRRMGLIDKAVRKALRLARYTNQCALNGGRGTPCIEPLPQDRRFIEEAWQTWPFNIIYQSFLLQQQWWHNATTDVRGVTQQHQNLVEFASRQILDMYSPSNFLWTNPEVLQQTLRQGGANLFRGAQNFLEDWERAAGGKKPVGADNYEIGRNLAITPGKVIYQNRLIELIQYAPATETVHPEPILIVPAWIMKYYILDLSPHNSLVRYLTEQGFTVFMMSWKNPRSEDRDLGMDDYRRLGVMAALDAVKAIVPNAPVHAVGYCLGGTLLAIAAAAMARDADQRLKSITLFAAEVDFEEPGELKLFINDSQVTFLEDMMWEQGGLDARQMAGTFQMLRSNDLIWSRLVHEYLLGEREPMSDLMAWNADATRMPYRMHSEYLRHLFLDNDLAEGRYVVEGKPIALADLRVPMFVVGATRDHVAPWRSVFKLHLLTGSDLTFLLASGGHNAGIVSEPGHVGHSYQIMTKPKGGRYLDPTAWAAAAPQKQGSWWPEWAGWLDTHSGDRVAPPTIGSAVAGYAPIADAPGLYVLGR